MTLLTKITELIWDLVSWRTLITVLIFLSIFGTYAAGRQHGIELTLRHADVAIEQAVMRTTMLDSGAPPQEIMVSVSPRQAEISGFTWWAILALVLGILLFCFITFLRMLLGAFQAAYVEAQEKLEKMSCAIEGNPDAKN